MIFSHEELLEVIMVLVRSSECTGRFGSLVVAEYCVCGSLKAVTDCEAHAVQWKGNLCSLYALNSVFPRPF